MRLDKSRTFGFSGPEPLTIADIAALSDLLDLKGDSQRCRFLDRIQLMDGVYLQTHYDAKQKKAK